MRRYVRSIHMPKDMHLGSGFKYRLALRATHRIRGYFRAALRAGEGELGTANRAEDGLLGGGRATFRTHREAATGAMIDAVGQ